MANPSLSTLILGIQVLIMCMAFAIGLSFTGADMRAFWHKPALMLRAALAMFVCVPLVAIALTKFLPLSPSMAGALLILAASAGVPLLPRKLGWLDHGPFAFGLLLHSALAAIFVLPLWLHLTGISTAVGIDPLRVARVLAIAYLLPILAGLLLRQCRPAFAQRLAPRLLKTGFILMLGLMLTTLACDWRMFAELRGTHLIALALLLLASIGIGHALGGPDEKDRSALAIACSQRHAGMAVLASTSLPGSRLLFGVMIYVLTAFLIELPYVRWRKSVLAKEQSSA